MIPEGTYSIPHQLPESPAEAPSKISPLESIDAPQRTGSHEAHSRFLHVVEQGVVLRKHSGRIRITRKDQTISEVPVGKLQGVLLYGKIQVSTQCLRMLMDEQVWLSLFTRNGVYKGRMQPPMDSGIALRRRQWERASDPSSCLEFGRAIVRGKILAARNFASAQAKNRLAATLGDANRVIRESLERVEEASSLEQLRGIEGSAARAYFDLFSRWNESGLPFVTREKRGADDPINALLNLGYTLVTREWDGLVQAAGLDPALGFYHQPDGGRPSLACDLMEEFRHALIDRLVLKLINRKIIQVDDFEDRPEERGLRLGNAGLRKFLSAYEQELLGARDNETAAFRSVFLKQLGRLLDTLSSGEPYRCSVEP